MTQVGTVYGQALYDLAKAEELSGPILSQMAALAESFRAEPDFLRLLSAPNLSKAQRCDILDQSLRQCVHLYVLNFLKLLTEKGYVRHFADCCRTYRECYNRDCGILEVTAVTAVPLTPSQRNKLKQRLSAGTGKRISLANRVEPGILGGMRLDYAGKRLDDTVSRRLEEVRCLLKDTLL